MVASRQEGSRLGRLRAAVRKRRPPDSRVKRLRASHSYGLVLTVVIGSLVATALSPGGPWGASMLVLLNAAILVVALRTTGVATFRSPAPLALIVVSGLFALLPIVTGGKVGEGALAIISAGLAVLTIAVIGRGAVDQGEVNRDSLRAAIAVYLLIGIVFVSTYSAVAVLGSGDLFAQGTDGSPATRFYFSFVTLATLGYGDYTPASELGRLLAVSEALLGQLYLVTVLSIIVARLGRASRPDPPP